MKQNSIGFIGGGNMAGSLIGGLIHDGCAADTLWVSDPSDLHRQEFSSRFGIHTTADNSALVAACDVVLLAVKPQVLAEVCANIATAVQQRQPLLISIAAGVRSDTIQHWLGGGVSLVRVMPNTPALVQSGAAGLFATAAVSDAQRDAAESIMRAVGLTLWVDDEASMDAVTALSGSGPAYFFLIMEAMEKAAQSLGLSAESARLLTLQTAFGASKMALESEHDAAELRRRVTSPGGTTEAALKVLIDGGIDALFTDALTAAHARSVALSNTLGEN
jgi:pyrroline-5-carboxylate reductase